MTDQSDSPGKNFGGTLYIYQKSQVESAAGVATGSPTKIDLAADVAALCMATTGANPVRPHMLMFNSTSSHAILSFVASGHVVIFDAETRKPVACIRSSVGSGGGRQAHAAAPSPDDSYILIANQNGKLLERINSNYATNQFTLDPAATIDLAGCTTPNGLPCQSADLRPDNAPIVPVITSDSKLAFVTLRGGGLFVVDPKATPMRIRAEYDKATIGGSGLTGMQIGDKVVVNSGLGFFAYRLTPSEIAASNAPNKPAPTTFISQVSATRDGHGMTAGGDGRFVWITDRATDVAEVFEVSTGAHSTVSYASSLSPKPAPDISDASPSGDFIFSALRGPSPLSGGALATGSTPGLGVVKVSDDGKTGTLQAILRVSNLNGTAERADAHGLRVRIKPSTSLTRTIVATLRRAFSPTLNAQVPSMPKLSASQRAAAAADKPQECKHGRIAEAAKR